MFFFLLKDPQLPEKWTHPIDATEAGFVAPALNVFTKSLTGNENCLTLNVYTREVNFRFSQKSMRKLMPVESAFTT